MSLLSAKYSRPLGSWENTPFRGQIIPFVAKVQYFQISAEDESRLHQFGTKVLSGIFFGYASVAVRIWKGDFLDADIEELGKLDTRTSTLGDYCSGGGSLLCLLGSHLRDSTATAVNSSSSKPAFIFSVNAAPFRQRATPCYHCDR